MNKHGMIIIATVFFLFTSSILQAQLSMGIEAGLNKNYLITNIASQSFTNYNSATGITIGLPVIYQFTKWFALEADPGYMQKNYKIERTGFYKGVYQNNNNSYIQLPILANFSLGGKKIRGFVNIGLYGAYWFSAKVKGVEPNILNLVDTVSSTVNYTNVLGQSNGYSYNEKYKFNNHKDNRLEVGWLTGVGLSYNLKTTARFFIEGRYTSSLTDQQKHYQVNQTPRYNDSYGISLGCLFRLKNKQGLSASNKNKR